MELRVKTALDSGLDAAVLAAITQAETIIQGQSTANYDATPLAIAGGQQAGQQVFTSNAARTRTTAAPTLNLTVKRSGMTVTATGSYTAQSATVFGKMFGTTTMLASGSAKSSLDLPKYMRIYIGYDISQSMGIASTQSDMTNMVNAIKTYYSTGGRSPQNSTQQSGCVFGCHVTTTIFQNASDPSFEVIGHNAGVTLRIDDVKQSILNIIGSAQPQTGTAATISLGLYSLQNDYSAVYNASTKQPSTNYSALTSAAQAIDLGPNTSNGEGDTNLSTALANLASIVSAAGDGSSANSPQTFVFILTDGVADVSSASCVDGHCTQALNSSWCQPFKDKKATVGVIYTTYVPFPNEQTYIDLVKPIQANIAPNLQQCASPGYYYEATDGPAIRAATQALFAQATQAAHLTQ